MNRQVPRTRRRRNAVLIVAGLAALLSCAEAFLGRTDIGTILEDPGAFENKTTMISGTVTNALRLPFVAVRLYAVHDGTGEVLVMTENAVPRVGRSVRVTGKVGLLATIGSESVGVHLVESKRRER